MGTAAAKSVAMLGREVPGAGAAHAVAHDDDPVAVNARIGHQRVEQGEDRLDDGRVGPRMAVAVGRDDEGAEIPHSRRHDALGKLLAVVFGERLRRVEATVVERQDQRPRTVFGGHVGHLDAETQFEAVGIEGSFVGAGALGNQPVGRETRRHETAGQEAAGPEAEGLKGEAMSHADAATPVYSLARV